MKKIISMILVIVCLLTSTIAVNADEVNTTETNITFSDVNSSDWFYDSVMKMSELKIVNGYEDGTFRPENNLMFEEFIKMVVVATYDKEIQQEQGSEWYKWYIQIAINQGYITEDMKSQIGTKISRKTMSDILYNVLAGKEKIKQLTSDELTYLSNQFDDLTTKDDKTLYIAYVGIITGYTDKTFKPNANLKRSETATVIMRLLDENIRKPIEIKYPKTLADLPEPDLDYLYNYPCMWALDTYTVAELNQMCYEFNHQNIVNAANTFISSAFNIDYTTIDYEETKKKLVYSMRDTVEYRGIKYDWLLDEEEQKTTTQENTYNDFLKQYISDIKTNKVKIQGQFYTDKSLCILVHGGSASRGIIRFKIDSAKDLDIVKEILFIRDTNSEKKDTLYDEIDYGGCDNSRYISNDSIKLKTGVWYELAVDIILTASCKNDGLYLYQNFDTSTFRFKYMYPIYIKELE